MIYWHQKQHFFLSLSKVGDMIKIIDELKSALKPLFVNVSGQRNMTYW